MAYCKSRDISVGRFTNTLVILKPRSLRLKDLLSGGNTKQQSYSRSGRSFRMTSLWIDEPDTNIARLAATHTQALATAQILPGSVRLSTENCR